MLSCIEAKIPHLSPGSENGKGPQAQQNEEALMYRTKGLFGDPAGHFVRQKSATIHQWLNLRPAIVLRPDTHASHPAPPCPLPYSVGFRACSSMYPDAYILDVNGNPVAEPNLHAANIAKIYAENWQGEANSATGRRSAPCFTQGRPLAPHRKDDPGACGPAQKQSGDKLILPLYL